MVSHFFNEQKLRDRGQGFGILVSKFPKDTSASYTLQEPNEVSRIFLLHIFLIPFYPI